MDQHNIFLKSKMMHETFVGGFDCPVCPHPGCGLTSIYTCFKLYRSFDVLLLDLPLLVLFILDSSAKPALMKAIVSQ